LGSSEADRLADYRALFRLEQDAEAISDIRKALNQGQPIGDARFIDTTERVIGQRRETRPRGWPRKSVVEKAGAQEQLSLEM
jgi:hypothetical protein